MFKQAALERMFFEQRAARGRKLLDLARSDVNVAILDPQTRAGVIAYRQQLGLSKETGSKKSQTSGQAPQPPQPAPGKKQPASSQHSSGVCTTTRQQTSAASSWPQNGESSNPPAAQQSDVPEEEDAAASKSDQPAEPVPGKTQTAGNESSSSGPVPTEQPTAAEGSRPLTSNDLFEILTRPVVEQMRKAKMIPPAYVPPTGKQIYEWWKYPLPEMLYQRNKEHCRQQHSGDAACHISMGTRYSARYGKSNGVRKPRGASEREDSVPEFISLDGGDTVMYESLTAGTAAASLGRQPQKATAATADSALAAAAPAEEEERQAAAESQRINASCSEATVPAPPLPETQQVAAEAAGLTVRAAPAAEALKKESSGVSTAEAVSEQPHTQAPVFGEPSLTSAQFLMMKRTVTTVQGPHTMGPAPTAAAGLANGPPQTSGGTQGPPASTAAAGSAGGPHLEMGGTQGPPAPTAAAGSAPGANQPQGRRPQQPASRPLPWGFTRLVWEEEAESGHRMLIDSFTVKQPHTEDIIGITGKDKLRKFLDAFAHKCVPHAVRSLCMDQLHSL